MRKHSPKIKNNFLLIKSFISLCNNFFSYDRDIQVQKCVAETDNSQLSVLQDQGLKLTFQSTCKVWLVRFFPLANWWDHWPIPSKCLVDIILGDPGATSRDDAIFLGQSLLQELKSPWELILTEPVQEEVEFCPADCAENYFSAQSAMGSIQVTLSPSYTK